MDRKKKFFIGLGVLAVIYMAVTGLNLTHQEESDKSKGAESRYSKSSVISMIENKDSKLQGYFNAASDIRQWFSFLLPELELFNNKTDTNYCNIVATGDESYILLNQKRRQCVIFINQSDESARLAALIYESEAKQIASRGFNLNIMKKTAVSGLRLSGQGLSGQGGSGQAGKQSDVQPTVMNNRLLEMIFLDDIDPSYYRIKNPDNKDFQLSHFTSVDKYKQANFDTVEKNKFELLVPEQGGVFIIQCIKSDCRKNNIKIRQTN